MWLLILPPCSSRLYADVKLPAAEWQAPIQISASHVEQWREQGERVVYLRGNCALVQGGRRMEGSEAVVWIREVDAFRLEPHRLTIYLEDARVTTTGDPTDVLTEGRSTPPWCCEAPTWLGDCYTYRPVEFSPGLRTPEADPPRHPILSRARGARQEKVGPTIQLAQFAVPVSPGSALPPAFVPQAPPPPAPRRFIVRPRSNVPVQTESFTTADGAERVTIVNSGVNIIIDGISPLGPIDISTDRAVIWAPGQASSGLPSAANAPADGGMPYELYLEGNIVFRQAESVIYARSMYYSLATESGVVLDAELLTNLPNQDGVVRLKADILRQLDRSRFHAHQAAVTTSRLGVPSYWFQAGDLAIELRESPVIDPFTGQVVVDPLTGLPASEPQRLASSRNNVVYLAETPVFFWPRFTTDLTRPSLAVNRIRFESDRIFGNQFGASVNLNQLFGLSARWPGTEWSASLDYLSERGWGAGSTYQYTLEEFFRIPGPTRGFIDGWFIDDQGLDQLGADRRGLTPEEDFRGRLVWQHRQRMLNGLQVTGELGWISDRNFLEQYYEREWDQWKDQATGLELKYLTRNASWNLAVDGRINDFFTQSEWLPRVDHFLLAQPLLQDRVTWHSHSQVGYGRLEVASVPTDPADAAKFNPMVWEVASEGLRAGARHELDLPLQLGAVKFVPYILGEVMHYGEDLTGQDNTRLMGQAGLRASLPMWRVDPAVQDPVFNLNGLAHKVVFEGELLWADANRNLDEFPLYDPLDDDAQEHFRRRFVDDIFGGVLNIADGSLLPLRFDSRYFAHRSGLQSWVTAPSSEIVDDLVLLRLGARQRWQTRRGVPGRQRIIDWMTLDVEGTYFPQSDEDNFGADFGLLNYDWRWHVGDRVTLMSNGFADTFGQGLRVATVGSYITRPERGSAFFGLRSIEGPISSNSLNTAFSYRMTHKWIASLGSVLDLGPAGNIGQVFELTRVGESFLVSVGANYDVSRNNVGFGVMVEPRFFPATYRSFVGGVPLAPVGAYGLE